jgi:hypothetical protein
MKILLHICCAPCAIYSVRRLKQKGHKVDGFWYNPNIHPFTEYRNRLESVRYFESQELINIIYEDSYEMEKFIRNVINDLDNRCSNCYEMRLLRTAQRAKKEGYDRFTTTLLISPYQDHSKINEIGERIGKDIGVEFFYEDLRPGFYESKNLAKEMSLYRQKYCGCIFSEKERYLKK